MNTIEILSQQIIKDVQKGARVIDIQFPENEGDPKLQAIVGVFSIKIAELMIEIEHLKTTIKSIRN